MQHKAIILFMTLSSFPLLAATDSGQNLQQEVQRLQEQTVQLQKQIMQLQQEVGERRTVKTSTHHPKQHGDLKEHLSKRKQPKQHKHPKHGVHKYHSSLISVHTMNRRKDHDTDFYPTALLADNHVVTYIAGTPVVTTPYLGARPAFDGSDYIVNISSINRDIRLLQQRRNFFRATNEIGYPMPQEPIVALSGKVEPVASIGGPNNGPTVSDITVGAGELDTAAIVNDKVEGYLSLAFDETQPALMAGQRLSNARVGFNMGFVNIGNLDQSPIYFTAGQLFAPYGRFSTSMISPPLTMIMARTKTRPFILGYKSQHTTGPYAALYGFSSDTTLGSNAAGGINAGWEFRIGNVVGEFGGSAISAINNAGGMQFTGSTPRTTFGGFASLLNGNEAVHKVPGLGLHADVRWDRYNVIAEWVGSSSRFHVQDLSFNGQGALPQAAQAEAGMTFKVFDKPATVAAGYQWTQEALALNLPQHRLSAVFNISLWKDTVESIEYRYDMNYKKNVYANGAAPTGLTNATTVSRGGGSDTVLAQIGVYF